MKNTQKNLVEFSKNNTFTVFHINSDGSCGTQYGGLNGLLLIQVMMRNIAKGVRMVIVPTKEAHPILRKEGYFGIDCKNSQKDPKFYETIKKYSFQIFEIIR